LLHPQSKTHANIIYSFNNNALREGTLFHQKNMSSNLTLDSVYDYRLSSIFNRSWLAQNHFKKTPSTEHELQFSGSSEKPPTAHHLQPSAHLSPSAYGLEKQ